MANTTEEVWTVDGTSLHTYAYGVEVLSEGIPPRRGSNFIVPYRHGELWRPKTYGARPLAMAMWVTNEDVNGNLPGSDTAQRAQLRQNVETLKALFAPYHRQVTLQRSIRLNAGLVTRQGLAECTGTLDFVPEADVAAQVMRFGVEMMMPDPYWYETTDTITSVPFAGGTVTNAGSARAQYMTIQLNGPLTTPRLTNTSISPNVSVTYNGVIAGGAYVLLDTNAFTAVTNLGANVIGNVSHSGARSWMELIPGGNTLVFAGSGSGSAGFTFKAPYL